MHYDISVLRAIVRLSRRRNHGFSGANPEALLQRVPGRAADLRASLRRLSRAGLVDVKPFGNVSLTLSGLTIAVASMPPKRRAQPVLRARAA
jgi:Mn-dependent DtxR family transcriptional regulator